MEVAAAERGVARRAESESDEPGDGPLENPALEQAPEDPLLEPHPAEPGVKPDGAAAPLENP
jgi:hypothetical protein